MASSSTRLFQVPCQDLKHSSRVLETAWRQGAVPFRDAWGQNGIKADLFTQKLEVMALFVHRQRFDGFNF
jgi:hypothetical protein